ncbi:hypothetical protein BH20CHL3_BH20CHL3_08940 [soil metagenome]
MAIAITLSGGGAAGDFQVGALRFLYDYGIVPEIICGTSVGAINAVKLAEGENPADPSQGLAGLEALWGSLHYNSDMYLPEPWLYDPDMDHRVRDFLLGRRSDLGIDPPVEAGIWDGKLAQFLWLWDDGRALLQSLTIFMSRARGLYNLDPIAARLVTDLDQVKVRDWVATGNRLRIAMVGLESGRLRYATEAYTVVERDGVTPVDVPGEIPDSCRQIHDALGVAEGVVDDLRQSLLDGDQESVRELIVLANSTIESLSVDLDACLRESPGGRIPLHLPDLIPTVLASAAVPGIFPPVVFGEETWVDGGVREILPLQAAIDLGGDPIYAISTSLPEEAWRDPPPRRTPYYWSKLPMIVNRAVRGIIPDEIARDDARATNPRGEPFTLYLIQPDFELHSPTTIDPGLIQIGRDYGFMRAADVVAGEPRESSLHRSSTEIARRRLQIWAAEIQERGRRDPRFPADPPRPLDVDIPKLKSELGELMDRRAALGAICSEHLDTPVTWLPAGLRRWVVEPELHSSLLAPEEEPEECGEFRSQLHEIAGRIAGELKEMQRNPANRGVHAASIAALRQAQKRLSNQLESRGCDLF